MRPIDCSPQAGQAEPANAHRWAILTELLAAKALCDEPDKPRGYVEWRVGASPDRNVPERPGVV